MGTEKGYKYAHDYKNHYVKQQYLPDGLTGEVFMSRRKTDMSSRFAPIIKKSKKIQRNNKEENLP